MRAGTLNSTILLLPPFSSSFSWLIALARTSSTMSNESGKNEYSFLISDLREKTLSVMLAVGFSCMPFIGLRKFHSIPSFLMVGLFSLLIGPLRAEL